MKRNTKITLTVTIILGTIYVLVFYNLPQITTFLSEYVFITKVDSAKTKLSRLELFRLTISLIGPILTIMVFSNTLRLQKNTEKKQNENLEKELLLQINKEFYELLDLFLKSKCRETLDNINSLSNNAINSEYGFTSNYSFQKNDVNPTEDTSHIMKVSSISSSEKPPGIILVNVDNKEFKKIEILNRQYEACYKYIGTYFKILHRIIKTLNEYLDDSSNIFSYKEYSKYIGILRTQITSNEFIVILYNSIYIKKGLGLGIQLIGTGFFGDDLDFITDQHFKTPDDELWYLIQTDRSEKNRQIRIETSNRVDIMQKDEYQAISNLRQILKKS